MIPAGTTMNLTRVWKYILLLSLTLFTASLAQAQTQTLYGATSTGGTGGLLVTLDPLTGSAALVGPLRSAANSPYSLTGLVFDPVSGVLYGATTPNSSTAPSSLVTVDPATGQVTTIGNFGLPNGSFGDIAFDRVTGALYGTRTNGGDLYTINPVTGAATLVGPFGGEVGSSGHGLAMSYANVLFTVPDGNRLYTFNTTTGAATPGALLTGGVLQSRNINAMDFNAANTLFGVNNQPDSGSIPHLVNIDPVTGAITDIGATLSGLDAIAFTPVAVPEPVTLISLGAGVVGVGCCIYKVRNRRRFKKKARTTVAVQGSK
ncbi:MAG TPA: hypothetical protein PLN21_17880 [Gemmatales bacterium]|nr:hypothetical protein [Gemmatales bacterium]